MATQDKRGYGNPYASSDLGSGARTTTGGSYRNPRLGIKDTTAFSRGVMSTLKTPEQEQSEEKQLEGSINYFGTQQDAILGGLEFKENSSLVNNFTNNQLTKMQIQYAKCSKANNQKCLQQINTDLGIYQEGQANIQNLIQNYADDEMYDAETSNGRFLIDVNGDKIKKADGSFATIADMTKVNNENPSDINIGIALNKNGDKKAVYQFKFDDGNTYTANISDYTDNYLKSNFDVRSNIHLNTQTAMNKDGSTSGWVDEPKMFESSTNITTEKDTFEASTFLGYENIVDDTKYWNDVDTAANTFSGELYKTTSSAGNNSAFNNLAKRLYNNKFTSIVEGYVRPSSENFDSFKRELAALPEDVKLAMLRDEGNEEWKIKNASKGHKRGDDGRAERLDEKYLIKKKYTQKPIDDGGDGSGFSYEDFATDFYGSLNKAVIGDVKGEKTAGDQEPFENFLQAYGVPIAGTENSVQSIKYLGKKGDVLDPNKIATDLSRLGTLNITWAKEGYDEKGRKIVGAMEIPYDLTDKDGIRKLVNHMSAFSPELKGTSMDAKRRRNAIIEGYEKAIQEVKN